MIFFNFFFFLHSFIAAMPAHLVIRKTQHAPLKRWHKRSLRAQINLPFGFFWGSLSIIEREEGSKTQIALLKASTNAAALHCAFATPPLSLKTELKNKNV